MEGVYAMSVHRRKDSGAWEVSIKGHRHSDKHWNKGDAVAFETAKLLTPLDNHTLEHALDKWLADYVPFLHASQNYINKANALRPLLVGKTIDQAPQVAAEARKAWAALKPATINRRLAILRRLCHLAFEEWHWIDKPIGAKIKLLTERNERHIYLTRAEVERLRMNCTNANAGDLIVFAAFTGLRLSELFRATKHDVHNGALRLDARTKSGRPRCIPLHPRALAIAQRLPLPITVAVLKKQWTVARDLSNLKHVHWHDLRHSCASWLIQSGASLYVVKEILGHQSTRMTERYAHLSIDNLQEAIDKL